LSHFCIEEIRNPVREMGLSTHNDFNKSETGNFSKNRSCATRISRIFGGRKKKLFQLFYDGKK
jgi:hypothetical protein